MSDDPNDIISYDDNRPSEYRPVFPIPSREDYGIMRQEVRQRINAMAQQYTQGADAQRLQEQNERLRALLLAYRQMFVDICENESFWYGREEQLAQMDVQAKMLGVEVQE